MAAVQSGLLRLAPGRPPHSLAPVSQQNIMMPVMSRKAMSKLLMLLCGVLSCSAVRHLLGCE